MLNYFCTLDIMVCQPLANVKIRVEMHSAYTDKPDSNCHFPAPGRNCITHCQALHVFLDRSQVSIYKNEDLYYKRCNNYVSVHAQCVYFN
jgi:hypothetical protein